MKRNRKQQQTRKRQKNLRHKKKKKLVKKLMKVNLENLEKKAQSLKDLEEERNLNKEDQVKYITSKMNLIIQMTTYNFEFQYINYA